MQLTLASVTPMYLASALALMSISFVDESKGGWGQDGVFY